MSSCKRHRLFPLCILLLPLLPWSLATAESSSGRAVPISSEPLRSPSRGGKTLFTRIAPDSSGIHFQIDVDKNHPRRRLYEIAFAGAGVAIGDYDGDGKPDVFMSHHTEKDRLYRQTGDLVFTDVSVAAGLGESTEWSSGASFVDINNDGLLDLYVCHYDAPNSLFINNGDGTFREMAADYGLDFSGASVMAAFSDYDRDGDLDMYLLTSRLAANTDIERQIKIVRQRGPGGRTVPTIPVQFQEYTDFLQRPNGRFVQIAAGQRDRLYRNDDGHFVEVVLPTQDDQSSLHGNDNYMGMSVVWWDYDNDMWPDIYISNDMFGPDRLYHNNGDGSFSEIIATTVPHTPWFSMGSDFADINNDGLFDLMAADMSATTHYEQKIGMGDMDSQGWFLDSAEPRQYMRNALYLNSGTGRFMETAFMAGLASTDWSWSVKFADFDNDAFSDVFVTNGMVRNFMDADVQRRIAAKTGLVDYWEILQDEPAKRDTNFVFRNTNGLQFEDASRDWGLDHTGLSFGAALGDLDRDGDLDLIVGNLDEPASLYRNDSVSGGRVLIRLKGVESNRYGVDAKVRVETDSDTQIKQLATARGFMSADDPVLQFGTGAAQVLRRLTVYWPSGAQQSFTDLPVDRFYTITEQRTAEAAVTEPSGHPLYRNVTAVSGLNFEHRELKFDDYLAQPLLPAKLSQLGPGAAWGDADGDGDDDVFIGAAIGAVGALYLNDGQGHFRRTSGGPWRNHENREDLGVLWFDADGDQDLDLLVTSGSVELPLDDDDLEDRLYLNDGDGSFVSAEPGMLPESGHSSGVVAASDFDQDGDLDLFIGGRSLPGQYPLSPDSRLLRNDGGVFSDVTDDLGPGLRKAGMVTAALWSDVDDDGDQDLLLGVEWGPITYFRNDEGRLSNQTVAAGLAERTGWWNGINSIDVDNDGDMDYVVTNTGQNTKYSASVKKPAVIYYGDFDDSGNRNIIEAQWEDDIEFPVRGLSCSTGAMPFLANEFETFDLFARANMQQLYSPQKLDTAQRFAATELRSGVLINDGGRFEFRPLPLLAQIAPAFGVVSGDFDLDGNSDIYMLQNSFSPQAETGRMNGGLSVMLLGVGNGEFVAMWPAESGLVVGGDAKSLTTADFDQDGRADFLVTRNDDTVMAFQNSSADIQTGTPLSVGIVGRSSNPTAIGAKITLVRADGTRVSAEVHAGSGYLSQSAPIVFFANSPSNKAVEWDIRWPDGMSSKHAVSGEAVQTIRRD